MARSSAVDAVEKFRFSVFVLNIGFDPVTLAQNFTGFLRAGFSEVSLPRQTTNSMEYRENIDSKHVQTGPGLTRYAPVTLRRGVTTNSDFFRWANDVHNSTQVISTGIESGNSDPQAAAPGEAVNFRRDVLVVAYGRGGGIDTGLPGGVGNAISNVAGAAGFSALGLGDVKKAWLLHNCWVTSYSPGDGMSATEDNTKLIEELELRYESFEEITPEALASNTLDAIASNVDFGDFF